MEARDSISNAFLVFLDLTDEKGGEEINPRVYQTVQHMGNAVHEFDTTFNALNMNRGVYPF